MGSGSLVVDTVDLLPDLVTVTMGGNEDRGFAKMVEACPYGGGILSAGKCASAVQAAQDVINADSMKENAKAILEGVVARRTNSPKELVVMVMGYPRLYNADTSIGKDCWMKKSRRASIDDLSTALEGVAKVVNGC